MGARAFTLIDRVSFQSGDTAIEIGSDRGEGSTPYLRQYCKERGIKFTSVDIDPERTEADVIMDGELWLRSLRARVAFAYLDNFDFIYPEIAGEDWIAQQKSRYRELGLKQNNNASRYAHFRQTLALQPLTRKGSLIVFDDTWATEKGYDGKGATAVPFLVNNGWRVELAGGEKWNGFFALRRVT